MKIKIRENIIDLNSNRDLFIYGLNGTGKTRILRLIEKYHTTGFTKMELDLDMVIYDEILEKDYEDVTLNIHSKVILNRLVLLKENLSNLLSYTNNDLLYLVSPGTKRKVNRLIMHIERQEQKSIPRLPEGFFKDLEDLKTSYDNDILEKFNISDDLIYGIKESYRKYTYRKSSNLSREKYSEYKNEKKIVALYTNRNVVNIDEVISKLRVRTMSKIDYNRLTEVKKHTEKLSSDLGIIVSHINRLNFELRKYIGSGYVFSIDFNSWDWQILKNSKPISLDFFSSGEKQIIILLACIALLEDTVILIDEPEISFSQNFAEKFMYSVKKLKNKSSRLVIVSHSYYIYEQFEEIDRMELKK